jgi:hypothetical protein
MEEQQTTTDRAFGSLVFLLLVALLVTAADTDMKRGPEPLLPKAPRYNRINQFWSRPAAWLRGRLASASPRASRA